MAATAHLDALADWLCRTRPGRVTRCASRRAALTGTPRRPRRGTRGGRRGRGRGVSRFPDDIRERLKVVSAFLRWISRQAHHIPATGHDKPRRVLLAQVVAVRFLVRGQRPEHGRGVAVHVRERVDGRLLARST